MLKLNYRLLVHVGVQLSIVTAFELFETRLEGILRWRMKFRINVGDGRDGVAGFFLSLLMH